MRHAEMLKRGYNDIFHKFPSKGESIRYSAMISRIALSMRSISGYGNLPALHGNADYPECTQARIYRYCLHATVARRKSLVDIDLFNLIPCNFRIMHAVCLRGYKKIVDNTRAFPPSSSHNVKLDHIKTLQDLIGFLLIFLLLKKTTFNRSTPYLSISDFTLTFIRQVKV